MSLNTDTIIILAAGDGSRLKSNVPKIFHKIGGLSLLDHIIQSSASISKKIFCVLKPAYDGINFDKLVKYNSVIKRIYQKDPIGTGDAVRCVTDLMDKQDNVDSYVYILYADIPLIASETLLNLKKIAINNDNVGVVVLAMPANNMKNLGKLIAAEEEGCIKGILEAKDVPFTKEKSLDLCNAGLLIKKSILLDLINKIQKNKYSGEFYITDIVKLSYNKGYRNMYFVGDINELIGVNTRQELSMLNRCFQDNERLKHMNNGVTLIAPETVFFSYDTEIEQDVVINPYVVFGVGVKIKSGSIIESFCSIESSNINNFVSVGPFSRVRPGTEIDSDVKIGNFVEIKNSHLHSGVKVNHLSYIGDTTIGKNTNVGGGSITCNYDGYEKYKTDIGDNVFIGSNSSLVAPLKIESNVIIAAGSVITKNIDEGDLGIARSNQINKKNWTLMYRNRKAKK